MIEEFLLGDGSVDWKKVKGKAIEFRQDPKLRLAEVLDYLMKKGKVVDYLREDALVLFRHDNWNLNPFHIRDENHWYFTDKGINEAKGYVKNFLNKRVKVLKEIGII